MGEGRGEEGGDTVSSYHILSPVEKGESVPNQERVAHNFELEGRSEGQEREQGSVHSSSGLPGGNQQEYEMLLVSLVTLCYLSLGDALKCYVGAWYFLLFMLFFLLFSAGLM